MPEELFYIGIFPHGGGHYFFKDPNKKDGEVVVLKGFQIDSLVQVDRTVNRFFLTSNKDVAIKAPYNQAADWVNKYKEQEPMAKIHLVRVG